MLSNKYEHCNGCMYANYCDQLEVAYPCFCDTNQVINPSKTKKKCEVEDFGEDEEKGFVVSM